MKANLRSDEQESHKAEGKDKAAKQVEVQKLHGIVGSKCGGYMERKTVLLPGEVSQVSGNRVRNS